MNDNNKKMKQIRGLLIALIVVFVFLGCKRQPKLDVKQPDIKKQVASFLIAKEIESTDELIKSGEAQKGRVGDYLLENDEIKVIIQNRVGARENAESGPGPFGGTIIDAEYKNSKVGDHFGESFLTINFSFVPKYDSLKVTSNGEDGVAQIVCTGHATKYTFITIKELFTFYNKELVLAKMLDREKESDFIKRLVKNAVLPKPQDELNISIITTYTLKPNTNYVEVSSVFVNNTSQLMNLTVAYLIDKKGGEVEIFSSGNKIGFAEIVEQKNNGASTGPKLPDDDFEADYFVALLGDKVSYGIVPIPDPRKGTAMNSSRITSARITTFMPDFNILSELIAKKPLGHNLNMGNNPEARNQKEMKHYFVVGDGDTSLIFDSLCKLRKDVDCGKVSGRVEELGTEEHISDARVVALKKKKEENEKSYRPIAIFKTDEDGKFGGYLPAGGIKLEVAKREHGYERANGDIKSHSVEIAKNKKIKVSQLYVPRNTNVGYTVSCADKGGKCPARITVVGKDKMRALGRIYDTILYDFPHGVVYSEFSENFNRDETDKFELKVEESGSDYDVWFSKGPLYLTQRRRVNASPDVPINFNVTLEPIIENIPEVFHGNYIIGADFHNHTLNSWDSSLTVKDRLRIAAGEGLEFIASGEHDYFTDYGDYVDSVGLTGTLHHAVGVEFSPTIHGHFTFFPLSMESILSLPGSYETSYYRYTPGVNWGTGETWNMTAKQIFDKFTDLAKYKEDDEDEEFEDPADDDDVLLVKQINHPRHVTASTLFQSHFDILDIVYNDEGKYCKTEDKCPYTDYLHFGNLWDDGGLTPPLLRLEKEEHLFSQNFNALEILNNVRKTSVMNFRLSQIDWFNLLNAGRRITATGNCDAHRYFSLEDGHMYPRSYVLVEEGKLAAADFDMAKEVARGIVRGKSFVSNGPIINAWLEDKEGTSYTYGETLKLDEGTEAIDLHMQVYFSNYVDVNQVFIYMNAKTPKLDNSKRPALVKKIDADPYTPQASALCKINLKEKEGKFEIESDCNVSMEPISNGYEFLVKDIALNGDDAWIVAEVGGSKLANPLFPVIAGEITEDDFELTDDGVKFKETVAGVKALAITNPIFVDYKNDGYKATGITFSD